MSSAGFKLETGEAYPLGASCQVGGVNFAIFSAHAEQVELCLYDDEGLHELCRLPLPARSGDIWHGFLPNGSAGTVYAYRVYGLYAPQRGHRFNPNKLLLDPYARKLIGQFLPSDAHLGFRHPGHDDEPDARDNSHLVPKCVVISDCNEKPVARPRFERAKTILYEAHVKGLTMLHPAIPERERGKFAGLASDQMLQYLKALGVTSIELLPVQSFISESFLTDRKLSNYWGYNSLAYFVPHQAYLVNDDVFEFRRMVDKIHDAGMEVILDIVFNHTAEGGETGPTLSFKGIDNLSYYRLHHENLASYINDSGCGNTLNIAHPQVTQLLLDSLRYWVDTMRVDGFRFDLATALGRTDEGFSTQNAFFATVAADPVLGGCKLHAEPWDIGPGGYQLGNFPAQWSEWNDQYRDTVRRYWRGDSGMLPEFARRIHGSSDIFERSGRAPSSTINFITCHDGFTLNDLVSFASKHNLPNLENNQDGHSENYSDNGGIEGATEDTRIIALRRQQRRNLLATLFFSYGTPLLLAGDELGHSQLGNNNAYCQDNEISWIDWSNLDGNQESELDFVKRLIKIRNRLSIFSLDKYVHYEKDNGDPAMEWIGPLGHHFEANHWGDPDARAVGQLTSWHCAENQTPMRLFMIYHAGNEDIDFLLPCSEEVAAWHVLFDTSRESSAESLGNSAVGKYALRAKSTVLLIPEEPAKRLGLK